MHSFATICSWFQFLNALNSVECQRCFLVIRGAQNPAHFFFLICSFSGLLYLQLIHVGGKMTWMFYLCGMTMECFTSMCARHTTDIGPLKGVSWRTLMHGFMNLPGFLDMFCTIIKSSFLWHCPTVKIFPILWCLTCGKGEKCKVELFKVITYFGNKIGILQTWMYTLYSEMSRDFKKKTHKKTSGL